MHILAVIPARAGSTEIPNTHIRIIGGHPLIYYSIRNALHSRYVTDIVVTTDSPEVGIIARQMGVGVHFRDASLCGNDVTLDAVVADAVPADQDWDYVVTLQPTSPTLRAETLDAAIQYTVENDVDTVISAINSPHFSWSVKDGKKVPNYTERLSWEAMPPYYIETGSFLISKGTIVTPKTRIGDKVDIFEISGDEYYDIGNFEELHRVSFILSEQKVAIYVNGNNKRGTGHIYRALEIADEFYVKPDIYYDINQTDPAIFGKTSHQLRPVNGIAELFEICKREQYTIFINDILNTSIDYMIGLKSVMPNAKIINFEDDGEGILKADLVFNALYSEAELPQVKAGEEYYIPSKIFMLYRPIKIREKVERVFISFGCADPQNYSDRLLSIVSNPEYANYHFVVVLGRVKHNIEALLEYNKYKNIEVFYDVSNMPELMTSCDMGITSRGRTGYELALLGIPSIAMAQNKREEKHGFVSNENGFTYIGLNPDDEVIESTLKMYIGLSQSARKKFQDKLLSHDLRGGRERVMGLINSL